MDIYMNWLEGMYRFIKLVPFKSILIYKMHHPSHQMLKVDKKPLAVRLDSSEKNDSETNQ
jgi:hypothetical protein